MTWIRFQSRMRSSLSKSKLRSGLASSVYSNFSQSSPKTRDVKAKPNSSPPSVKSTPEIEKNYVHRVYDAIAPHFSSTRFAKWPRVAAFLSSLPPGSLILDAGCGNGKYLGLNPNCFFIGCDVSTPLTKICSDKDQEVLVADAVDLPYREGFGDAAISIAVLHHLSTEERRKGAVEELVRVVRPGGLVLITVWAAEQEDEGLVTKWTPLLCPKCADVEMNNHQQQQREYFVPWHLPYHRAEVSGGSVSAAVASGFAKRDDRKGAVVYKRYYHVFGEGELERLASGVGDAVVVDRFYDKSNWCIVLQKK